MKKVRKVYLSTAISICLLIFYLCVASGMWAQPVKYRVYNVEALGTNAIEGQAWPGQVTGFYDRLPAKAQNLVRKEVWNLSKNTAGLQLLFTTDAKELIVRYQTGGGLQMPHMPAIGVSGVDLYVVGKNGHTSRANGHYVFGDTVRYHYASLAGKASTEYILYLPLYNSVKWMEIWVPDSCEILPVAPRSKPVVIYGTSIAQGGCASRPGMAFTNILSRNIQKPVINLAFSGNGKMEPEMIDLLTEIDASIYIIDCLPNLSGSTDLTNRINYAATTLKKSHPATPILFVDHCGLPITNAKDKNRAVEQMNLRQQAIIDSLKKQGMRGLHYLSRQEINLDENSVVDYIHPNDMGMVRYADAYTKALRKILGL